MVANVTYDLFNLYYLVKMRNICWYFFLREGVITCRVKYDSNFFNFSFKF